MRYISLFTDYFALFLLLGIAVSGVLDALLLARGRAWPSSSSPLAWRCSRPSCPTNLSALFFVHLTLVSTLVAYLPFSKLVHMGGVFLSPTRNLANNNRMKRHVNPWNYPVKVHTYEEWEDEFRDKIEAAGLPLERPEACPTRNPKNSSRSSTRAPARRLDGSGGRVPQGHLLLQRAAPRI